MLRMRELVEGLLRLKIGDVTRVHARWQLSMERAARAETM